MKITVIIPTYNECESIKILIDTLEKEFQTINHSFYILVVDSNSPDGTANIVRQQIESYQNVYLLVEKKKRGLGIAYINGMHYAVEKLYSDAFIEFDGDFQHDPKDIKYLVAEFDNGYDYVIGSRYVSGGSIPKEWAWYRKLLSRFGNLFIKYILCLSTKDNTSGFKLTRVKDFSNKLSLSEDKLLSRSYAYKIQFLYEMIKAGAKIKEVPIKFLERQSGDSKSSFKDIQESLKIVLILFYRKIIGRYLTL